MILAESKGKCVCDDGKIPTCPDGEGLKCPNGDTPDLTNSELPDPFSKCTWNKALTWGD